MPVVCIEGNIGVGKTTLCTHLAHAGLTVYYEHVHPQLLELFYTEPAKYSFVLQLVNHADRQRLVHSVPGTTTILDRSVLGDYVFAAVNATLGYITPREWAIYQSRAGRSVVAAVRQHLPRDATIICLVDEPVHCLRRAQARNLSDAHHVELAYLELLDTGHRMAMQLVARDGHCQTGSLQASEYMAGALSAQDVLRVACQHTLPAEIAACTPLQEQLYHYLRG